VSGRVELNVVHAHSGSSDHTQLFGVFQKLRVNLHRRPDNERIRSLQVLLQFAVQLIRRQDGPARLLKLLYR